jgi:hypothetical protein
MEFNYVALLGLVFLLQSCGKPQTITGVVTNPRAESSLEILEEKEVMLRKQTSKPYGSKVKKTYTETKERTIKVCGARTTKSSSKSSSTPKKSSSINLKKDTSKPNKPKPTVEVDPCNTKKEKYTVTYYDVEVERWYHHTTLRNTSNRWGYIPSYPNIPNNYLQDDDYKVGSRSTSCTVNIPSANVYNAKVDCNNIYKQLKPNSIITGEYSVMGELQNIRIN